MILLQVIAGLALGWGLSLVLKVTSGTAVVLLAVTCAALLPVLQTLLLTSLSCLMSRAPGNGPLWWLSLWGEFRAGVRIFLLQQPWASATTVKPAITGVAPKVPVLLVHGYVCNHRLWDEPAADLCQAGHAVLAIDLEPVFTSIDNYAALVQAGVDRLCRDTGAAQVALVGHSMGGLAIRAWLRSHGPLRAARIVTLGTPHAGTRIDPLPITPNSKQMVFGSDWLAQLAAGETPALRSLMHIALTPQDNIVYPQREQVLAGASVTVFEGLGHLQMVRDKGVRQWLLGQLEVTLDNGSMPDTHPNAPAHAAIPAAPRPNSLADLFWAFTWLALQGFGGVLVIVQRELVEKKKWLTKEQFVEDWAVAQILPGPNVVNLSLMIGDRYFGMRGAFTALVGILGFPLLVVLLLAALFAGVADMPAAQGALRGMGAVAAGLISAAGLKLMSALKTNVMGTTVCIALAAITFIAIALLRVPLAWVLLAVGGVACVWAYRQLGQLDKRGARP